MATTTPTKYRLEQMRLGRWRKVYRRLFTSKREANTAKRQLDARCPKIKSRLVPVYPRPEPQPPIEDKPAGKLYLVPMIETLLITRAIKKGAKVQRVYDVWQGTGQHYQRGAMRGKEKRQHLGRIGGSRGAWYVVGNSVSGYIRWSAAFKTREEAVEQGLRQCNYNRPPSKKSPRKPTRKHWGIRKWQGDDLYSWAVYHKGTGRVKVSGCSRAEANYYADKFEAEENSRG